MFRAAVAISGMVNLTSAYGALTDYGESFGVSYFEDEYRQGRMGASLWDQRERFIIGALREEAIASSMLEGAATTRQEAKRMLKSGRKARNTGEQMVLNSRARMEYP